MEETRIIDVLPKGDLEVIQRVSGQIGDLLEGHKNSHIFYIMQAVLAAFIFSQDNKEHAKKIAEGLGSAALLQAESFETFKQTMRELSASASTDS